MLCMVDVCALKGFAYRDADQDAPRSSSLRRNYAERRHEDANVFDSNYWGCVVPYGPQRLNVVALPRLADRLGALLDHDAERRGEGA